MVTASLRSSGMKVMKKLGNFNIWHSLLKKCEGDAKPCSIEMFNAISGIIWLLLVIMYCGWSFYIIQYNPQTSIEVNLHVYMRNRMISGKLPLIKVFSKQFL